MAGRSPRERSEAEQGHDVDHCPSVRAPVANRAGARRTASTRPTPREAAAPGRRSEPPAPTGCPRGRAGPRPRAPTGAESLRSRHPQSPTGRTNQWRRPSTVATPASSSAQGESAAHHRIHAPEHSPHRPPPWPVVRPGQDPCRGARSLRASPGGRRRRCQHSLRTGSSPRRHTPTMAPSRPHRGTRVRPATHPATAAGTSARSWAP